MYNGRIEKMKKLLGELPQLFARKTIGAVDDDTLIKAARVIGPIHAKVLSEIERRQDAQGVIYTSLKRPNRPPLSQTELDALAAVVRPHVSHEGIELARRIVNFFKDNDRASFLMDEAIEVIGILGEGDVIGCKIDEKTGEKRIDERKARIVLGDLFGRNTLHLHVTTDSKGMRHYWTTKPADDLEDDDGEEPDAPALVM